MVLPAKLSTSKISAAALADPALTANEVISPVVVGPTSKGEKDVLNALEKSKTLVGTVPTVGEVLISANDGATPPPVCERVREAAGSTESIIFPAPSMLLPTERVAVFPPPRQPTPSFGVNCQNVQNSPK